MLQSTCKLHHLALTTEYAWELGVHWKNEECKKYACKALPVTIELTKEVHDGFPSVDSACAAEVCCFHTTQHLPFHASCITTCFANQTQTRALPPSWIIAPTVTDSLVLCKLRYISLSTLLLMCFSLSPSILILDGLSCCVHGNHFDVTKHEFLLYPHGSAHSLISYIS